MHRSFDAAYACIARDHRTCKTQGGYSDRVVRVIHSRKELESYDVTRGPGATRIITKFSEGKNVL